MGKANMAAHSHRDERKILKWTLHKYVVTTPALGSVASSPEHINAVCGFACGEEVLVRRG
jgi:hypothetical protein